MKSFLLYLFTRIQYLLPHTLLSELMGALANIKTPWVKNSLIRAFASFYPIDFSESEKKTPGAFSSFNDFFTRALEKGARNIEDSIWVSPCDGVVSQSGNIKMGTMIQAKGRIFSASELLFDTDENPAPMHPNFENGSFCTIYLAPHNYHRVHLPIDAKLLSWRYVPGRLFSVNNITANSVDRLFSRNERIVFDFETQQGKMAYVMVGAMIVGSIVISSLGRIPRAPKPIFHQLKKPKAYRKGEELGQFCLGSTVILLSEKQAFNQIQKDKTLLMGQSIS